MIRSHGLRQVGVEAGLERALPVVGLTVPADRDEDHLRISGADPARDLVAVHHGQPDVDEDDVGTTRLGLRETARTVGCRVNAMALVLQEGAERLPGVRIVLDDEHRTRRAAIRRRDGPAGCRACVVR